MKQILVAGDSFTYGYELKDRNKSWAAIIAKSIDYNLINIAVPGNSNDGIIRSILEHDLNEVDIVILGWTNFDRIEVADDLGIYQTWPGGIRKKYREEAAWREIFIDYFSKHFNEIYMYRKYLQYVILMQSYFLAKNVQFLMLDAFENNNKQRFDTKNNDLITKIKKEYFVGWPNETMMTWTDDTPKGPDGHFLDEGHTKVANKIALKLKEVYNIKIINTETLGDN